MSYSSFCTTLTVSLKQLLEPGTTLTRKTIPKNNGIRLDALIVTPGPETISPVIYLEPLYECYKRGSTMETICRAVLSSMEHKLPFSPELCLKVHEFESVKQLIGFRIISRRQNEELLKDVPWIPFLDLAIVFFLHLASTDDGQITALIHNSLAGLWDMPAGRLLHYARRNTPALFPASITDLGKLVAEANPALALPPQEADSLPALYVLTNRNGIYGASCMLYDNIIKDFAEREASDVIILPSSIHEVLLLPDSSFSDYDSLCTMVQEINRTEVPPEDVLSDHIYLYTRCDQSFKTWPFSLRRRP